MNVLVTCVWNVSTFIVVQSASGIINLNSPAYKNTVNLYISFVYYKFVIWTANPR